MTGIPIFPRNLNLDRFTFGQHKKDFLANRVSSTAQKMLSWQMVDWLGVLLSGSKSLPKLVNYHGRCVIQNELYKIIGSCM